MKQQKLNTKSMALCALFAALTAVLSQLAVPIGPVPVNLATLSVLLCGSLCGPRLGAFSMILYLLCGLCGLPVFSMLRSGAGVLFGPTGGYLMGYVAAAWVCGLCTEHLRPYRAGLVLGLLSGFVSYMMLGTVWYMTLMQADLWQALLVCVLPFLPGDLLKMVCAGLLSLRLRQAGRSILPLSEKSA